MKKLLYLLAALLLIVGIGIATQIHADIPVDQLKAKYGQPPSKFVEIDDMQVHYRDEGTGFPVVLIHGTSSSLHTWNAWTDSLSKKYRVIRMDLPAFGLTGPNTTNDYDIASYTSFVEHFLQKLDIKECYMAGNSLGGFITWRYAASHPAQVKKMVLIDAAGFPLDKIPLPMKLGRNPIAQKVMRYFTPRFLFAKSLKEVYGDPAKVNDSLVTRYFELGLREGNRNAFIARCKMRIDTNTAALPQIKIPTLIEWGHEDRWIPVKNAERFHQAIAGSTLIIYPNLGHVPMEEDPAVTVKDAMGFLQSSP